MARWQQPDERFAVIAGITDPVAADPWPELPPDALGEDHVRPWLLPGVYERMTAGQGQFLAELRPAVALFARFGGIDYDTTTQAAAKLDAYIRWVQQHRGALRRRAAPADDRRQGQLLLCCLWRAAGARR